MEGFHSKSIDSNTGYFTLKWDPPVSSIQLYQKTDSNWELIYSGENSRIALSGYETGFYEFALCKNQDTGAFMLSSCDQSTVQVKHFSLLETIGFFSLGVVMFISILSTIIYNSYQTSKRDN